MTNIFSKFKNNEGKPGGAGVGNRVGPLGLSGLGAMVVPMLGAGVLVTSIVTPWKLQKGFLQQGLLTSVTSWHCGGRPL